MKTKPSKTLTENYTDLNKKFQLYKKAFELVCEAFELACEELSRSSHMYCSRIDYKKEFLKLAKKKLEETKDENND